MSEWSGNRKEMRIFIIVWGNSRLGLLMERRGTDAAAVGGGERHLSFR